MYKKAFETFSGSLSLFAAIAVAVTLIELFLYTVGVGVSIVVYGIVALISHRIVLFDETFGVFSNTKPANGDKLPYWGFIWRYGVVTLVLMVCMLIMTLLSYELLADFFFNADLTLPYASLLVSFAAFGLALSRWGTVFPAVVASGDTSLAAAARRSEGRFWSTFQMLGFGPFLISIATMALHFPAVMATSTSNVGIMLIIDGLATLAGLFSTHMAAVILSTTYQDAEGRRAT